MVKVCKISNAEKAKFYREQKKYRRKSHKLKCYHRNSEKYNKNKTAKRNTKVQNSPSIQAVYKRRQRANLKQKREKQRTYKEMYRNRLLNTGSDEHSQTESTVLMCKMKKSRAIHKLRNALPKTPDDRVVVLNHYMSSKSPTAQKITSLKRKNSCVSEQIVSNIKTFIQEKKHKRSTESLTVMNILSASVSGENISSNKKKSKAARKLGLQARRLSGGERIRTSVLKSEKSCFELTKRRTRTDATSDNTKKLAYEFWTSPENSRTTGNKSDIKRTKIAPKEYVSHSIQILEKTQTEIYLAFKNKYPEITMCQRLFESYKPFFVSPVRPKDRNTCCCRMHVEVKIVFKKCMELRKTVLKLHAEYDKEKFAVFENIYEISNKTLCNTVTHDCLTRNCQNCGVSKLMFLNEELEKSSNAKDVNWEKYEYLKSNVKGGKTISKIQLVKQVTKPGSLFEYFIKLLENFPAHQMRANWQNSQYKNINQNLPLGHAVCLHDYSENYRCSDRTELQSAYFQKTEVSIHVTILTRHAILELDGVDSTVNSPVIVSEQFFVISPDYQHDRHFTFHCQKLISDYLKSISADITVMHEFTDGCSSQYKSRNCMGDVSFVAESELGYSKLIRNFFETSHAKGPQDAAGGFLKHQADYAVLRGKTHIQNAKDFFTFAEKNLQQPKKNGVGELTTRDLSCYECEKCIIGDVKDCENVSYIGQFRKTTMICSNPINDDGTEDNSSDSDTCRLSADLISKKSVIAVLADDPDYEYYLMKVTVEPFKIEKETTDSWGCTFQSGATVIKGLYYDRVRKKPFLYKLVPRKIAICHTVAVLHLCSEVDAGNMISIPEELHLDIIESISTEQ
ncbi:unnamed protein product [Mytilus edulis]|uniref:Uncharacterized protein n=1 Tax=Mytilus edulis TaxID=6550 RepID=A0A8S3VBZ8_MYTED|nr:unnamed protein product [Mytilus edulis]